MRKLFYFFPAIFFAVLMTGCAVREYFWTPVEPGTAFIRESRTTEPAIADSSVAEVPKDESTSASLFDIFKTATPTPASTPTPTPSPTPTPVPTEPIPEGMGKSILTGEYISGIDIQLFTAQGPVSDRFVEARSLPGDVYALAVGDIKSFSAGSRVIVQVLGSLIIIIVLELDDDVFHLKLFVVLDIIMAVAVLIAEVCPGLFLVDEPGFVDEETGRKILCGSASLEIRGSVSDPDVIQLRLEIFVMSLSVTEKIDGLVNFSSTNIRVVRRSVESIVAVEELAGVPGKT